MSNMDYAPVKFMIKCFEANYPESLGVVIVHSAPWIFQGIWKIIRGWLDPVVASKIHFTNHLEDLEQYIPRRRIVKEMGGDEDWTYEYVEPLAGENKLVEEDEGTGPRERLRSERNEEILQFQTRTFDWIASGHASVKRDRDLLAARLKENYWQLDPYVRARTLYDRTGVIGTGGRIEYYSSTPSSPAVNGAAVGSGAQGTDVPPVLAGVPDDVD